VVVEVASVSKNDLILLSDMQSISTVIVCRNEEDVISKTLNSLRGLTDDIVVYDNGSTDNTRILVQQYGANLFDGSWEGFGKTKKKAVSLAKYDWILSLDADEALDEELKQSLLQLQFSDTETVYEIRFKNFFADKYLRYGEWGGDKHIRLFNRRSVNWDESLVHEKLVLPAGIKIKKLKGFVLHQTVRDVKEYAEKTMHYAFLNASKYFLSGKKSSRLKIVIAPVFGFIKYYIIRLGFLDGWEGFICARMTSFYIFLKYEKLRELNRRNNK
jgi:glycosyltransferase involved in cell wall biosynthesis